MPSFQKFDTKNRTSIHVFRWGNARLAWKKPRES